MWNRKFGLFLISSVIAIAFSAPAMPGTAGENAPGVRAKDAKKTHHRKKGYVKKDRAQTPKAGKVGVTDGTHHPEAVRGTGWVIYDDGSREAWGADWAPHGGAAGNKFTSTWGSFYVDMISAYAKWMQTTGSFYWSRWTGTRNGGADLTGGTWTGAIGLSNSGSGWVQNDGSTSPIGFIGNAAKVFSNTAWLGVFVSGGNDIGIDTNGGGSHGFYVEHSSGGGYHEMSWNAMIRARFNGSNVPVEMMSLSLE